MHQLYLKNNEPGYFQKWLIFIFILLSISLYSKTVVNNENVNDEGLKFSIKIIEKEVEKDQPMKIELCFESKKKTYRLYKDSVSGMAEAVGPGDWLHFIIIAPDGTLIERYHSGLFGPKRPYRGEYVNVKPDNHYKEKIDLRNGLIGSDCTWPQSGKYDIMAMYKYKYKKPWKYGQDLWEGKVKSNWISIKVK